MAIIEIFYSYAHKDEFLREELEKHLSGLRWQGLIVGWHDRRIVAGQEWADEIDTHLNTARIILLLISPDFMASKYCYGIEVKRAIERHQAGEAKVIPIILRPVYWQGAPLGKLQALPTDAIPVTSSKWHDLDEAFFDVTEGIRTAIEELTANTVKQIPFVGNAQDEARRNGQQSKTYNANPATPTPHDSNLLTNPSKPGTLAHSQETSSGIFYGKWPWQAHSFPNRSVDYAPGTQDGQALPLEGQREPYLSLSAGFPGSAASNQNFQALPPTDGQPSSHQPLRRYAGPPPLVSQQRWWSRGKWRRNVLLGLLGLVIVSIIAPLFLSLSFPSNGEKTSGEKTSCLQRIVPPDIGVTKTRDGEYIGISDGSFAFDTQRPDGKLKIQAAEQRKAHDFRDANSLWNQAVKQEPNDAETQIYMEDQHILDAGNPYISIVVGTTLSGNSIAMAAGREATQAAYVAQKEYNTASKQPCGVKIRLLIASSGGVPASATTVAQQIVQLAQKDNSIVAVMGWTSTTTTLNAITVLSSVKIPMVTNSGGDQLTGMSPYFFRVVPPASVQGQFGAVYAEQRYHARTAAVFFDENQNFMSSLANGFTSRFTHDGNTIVATELYTVGKPETLPQLLHDALSKHPDLIYFAGYSGDVGGILAHLQDSDPPIVGGSSLYQLAFSPEAQRGLAHLSFTATGYPDEWDVLGLGKRKPAFFADYKAYFDPYNKHSASPYGYARPDGPTMEMFDAIAVLLYGCNIALKERVPLTRSGLQHALTEVTGPRAFQGVSSQISFSSDSNAIDRAIVFICVTKGGFFKMGGIYGKLLVGEAYRRQIFPPSACG